MTKRRDRNRKARKNPALLAYVDEVNDLPLMELVGLNHRRADPGIIEKLIRKSA